MGRLDGKIALISGGARGQGAAEAILFAREGAKVVFDDLLDDEGKRVEAQVAELGGEATYVHLDVNQRRQLGRRRADRTRPLRQARHPRQQRRSSGTPSSRSTPRAHSSAQRPPYPRYAMRAGGSIINISSIAGIIADPTGIPAYQASKGAIRLLTKSTAIQYAADNIRCNSVHPGLIVTAMSEDVVADPDSRQAFFGSIPLGRLGTVEDIANGVLFLASDESSFVTGSELVIDGGLVAQ